MSHQILIATFGSSMHCCPKHSTKPATNRSFWQKKFESNIARDIYVTKELRKQGWRVVRIWEHDLVKNPEGCIRRIRKALAS